MLRCPCHEMHLCEPLRLCSLILHCCSEGKAFLWPPEPPEPGLYIIEGDANKFMKVSRAGPWTIYHDFFKFGASFRNEMFSFLESPGSGSLRFLEPQGPQSLKPSGPQGLKLSCLLSFLDSEVSGPGLKPLGLKLQSLQQRVSVRSIEKFIPS